MKKIFILMTVSMFLQNTANASPFDVMMGIGTAGGMVTSAVITKNAVENSNRTTDAFVRNIDAQTENIKKSGGLQIVSQPDGTAKVYQNGVEVISPYANNPEAVELGLKMGNNFVDWMEMKKAKEKLKFVKAEAKAEKDKETLAIIRKYKKIDPRDLLQKIEENKKIKK